MLAPPPNALHSCHAHAPASFAPLVARVAQLWPPSIVPQPCARTRTAPRVCQPYQLCHLALQRQRQRHSRHHRHHCNGRLMTALSIWARDAAGLRKLRALLMGVIDVVACIITPPSAFTPPCLVPCTLPRGQLTAVIVSADVGVYVGVGVGPFPFSVSIWCRVGEFPPSPPSLLSSSLSCHSYLAEQKNSLLTTPSLSRSYFWVRFRCRPPVSRS